MSSNQISTNSLGTFNKMERNPRSSNTADGVSKESISQHVDSIQELKKFERQGEPITISEEQLVRAIERAIKALQGPNTSLEFSIHNKTKEVMVKVIDKDSGEVIREIPPEKQLDFLAKLWEKAGILIDELR